MADHSLAIITWDGEVPPPEFIAKARASLAEDLVDLEKPEDLIFHTVILGDSCDGPTITLSSDKETGGFRGLFSWESEWISIDELDAD